MSRPALTARGVKTILTRAGVDHHAQLAITDDPTVWESLETGRRNTSVRITGPREARRHAAGVLFGKGLSCAPYPDRDEWSR